MSPPAAGTVVEGGPGGGLQRRERPARVAAGHPDQVVLRVRVERHRAGQASGVGDGPADHDAHVVVGQRVEGEQQRAAQQRRDHRERGVLRGRRDQGDPPVLDRGQQCVLLRLGEPVHLVDEQDGPRAVQRQVVAGPLDDGPDVLDPRGDRRQLDEAPAGGAGGHRCERGLARPGRPPQDHRHRCRSVGTLHQAAQRRAGAQQVRLPDQLVDVARSHPDRQRRPGTVAGEPLVEQGGGHPGRVRAGRDPGSRPVVRRTDGSAADRRGPRAWQGSDHEPPP